MKRKNLESTLTRNVDDLLKIIKELKGRYGEDTEVEIKECKAYKVYFIDIYKCN